MPMPNNAAKAKQQIFLLDRWLNRQRRIGLKNISPAQRRKKIYFLPSAGWPNQGLHSPNSGGILGYKREFLTPLGAVSRTTFCCWIYCGVCWPVVNFRVLLLPVQQNYFKLLSSAVEDISLPGQRTVNKQLAYHNALVPLLI